MAWTDAVITNSGLALLSEVIDRHTLTISDAVIGSGTVQASALMAQTAITEPINVSAQISEANNLSEGIGKLIRIQIRNTDVTSPQTMRQIGLYASLDDSDNVVLFAIMQDNIGENIPSEEEYPDFLIEFSAAVALSQIDGITVKISGSAIVTKDMLDTTSNSTLAAAKSYTDTQSAAALASAKAYTDNGDSSTLAAAKSYSAPLNHTHTTSDITNFPTSLPANGGNADTLNIPFYNGIDILDFASENAEKGKLTCVRIMNSTSCPTNHGYDINDNDFCYRIFKILDNSSWLTIIGIDVRSNDIFVQSRIDDVWSGWKRINDGGNADTVDGKHASDFASSAHPIITGNITMEVNDTADYKGMIIPWIDNSIRLRTVDRDEKNYADLVIRPDGSAIIEKMEEGEVVSRRNTSDGGNAAALENHPASDFVLKSEYDAHAANAEVHVTTGAQTFSGAKTFAGQLIPAGASDVATPQARKIYAGTADLTAGTSALETGAIYLVYE